jgi:hypothetical protein
MTGKTGMRPIRAAIDAQEAEASEPSDDNTMPSEGWPCLNCRQGHLRVIGFIAPRPSGGG